MGHKMNVIEKFFLSVEKCPKNIALQVDGVSMTYDMLAKKALSIASVLGNIPTFNHPCCGILGGETTNVYEGILGILMSGHGYVPFNINFPVSRTTSMLNASEVSVILVDKHGLKLLPEMLVDVHQKLTIVMIDDR